MVCEVLLSVWKQGDHGPAMRRPPGFGVPVFVRQGAQPAPAGFPGEVNEKRGDYPLAPARGHGHCGRVG